MTRTAPPPLKTAEAPTHEQCYNLFEQTLNMLRELGWYNERIDTLVHQSNTHNRQELTIRHHYDHGTWTLYLEPNRYWNREAKPIRTSTIRRAAARLQTVEEILSQLFGDRYPNGGGERVGRTRKAVAK